MIGEQFKDLLSTMGFMSWLIGSRTAQSDTFISSFSVERTKAMTERTATTEMTTGIHAVTTEGAITITEALTATEMTEITIEIQETSTMQ